MFSRFSNSFGGNRLALSYKKSLMSIIFSTLAMTQVRADNHEIAATPSPQQQPAGLERPARANKCRLYAKSMRIAGRHIEAGGIGYNQGYTTLEGFFAPRPTNGGFLPFLDLRGHLFNDGRFAANAGMGLRFLGGCRVYGINSYYDYRKTKHTHYNQFTLGLETLGDLWDFRVNGYLPFGDKKSSPYRLKFDHFSGNNIILSQRFEYALKGGDAEVGFHFGRRVNWDSWIAAGPYYFIGQLGGPRWGVKGRIGASFYEYLTLEFINSWDQTFHYRPQAQITLAWPFGPKVKTKRENCPCSLSERMIQPVSRQEIIVVDRANKDTVAINPVTGAPFFVVFVDNTSSSNGTFESPYSSLAQAQSASLPGDIIYVLPGDGTTTNMDMGINLQLDQSFWGSGVAHDLLTTRGSVLISAQSAATPLITNTAGSAITLANGNAVSGFSITRPFLHGVNGSDVTNVSLSNLMVFGAQDNVNGGNGINIVENNGITNNLTLSNLFLTNNADNGIFIQINGTSSANVLIENSTSEVNGIDGIVMQSNATSNMNATLKNNVVINNIVSGLVLNSSSAGVLNYYLENNTYSNNNSFGVTGVFTGNSNVTASLIGNSMISNGFQNQFSFIGPALLTARNNHFDENVTDGCSLTAGNSAFSAIFENNSLSLNGSAGLRFVTNGSQTINFTVHNNDASYNHFGGMVFNSAAGMELNTELLGNNVIGNGGNGIFFGQPASILSIVANDNIINGNSGTGITVLPSNNPVTTSLSVDLNNNTLIGNFSSAILVTPGTLPSYTLTATNNNVSGNGSYCVSTNTQGANVFIELSDNIFSGKNNSGPSVNILSSPSGSNNLEIICQNNQVSNTLVSQDGIFFQYNGTNTGTNSFTALNNNAFNARNGINLNIATGASGESMDIDVSNNEFSANANNGFTISTSTANAFTLNTTLSGNNSHNNNSNGIAITAQNSAILNIHAEQNTFFNNDISGVADMIINHNSMSGSTCLDMQNNTSNLGYSLVNAGGTFNLSPNGVAGAQAVNVGAISTTGTITSVPTCP